MTHLESSAKVICGDSRAMLELPDAGVELVITSPPYWQIKDYGIPSQIGFGQSLHDYLYDLTRVWSECARVLKPGRRLCINIGDQFARSIIYGRYKIIPLHSEVIAQCESLGLDYMGAIIWQKKTTMNTTGGAVIMGSFPHPPNGVVELDYEYILLFKKPGKSPVIAPEQKAASALTTAEWKEYFAGHWNFGGARQVLHEAQFPEELPRRLIRMFSFQGETVLDPFLGSGTTAKTALELGRSAIGYELNPEFLPVIRGKLGCSDAALPFDMPITVETRCHETVPVQISGEYRPTVQDAVPVRDVKQFKFAPDQTYRVSEIIDETTLRLDTGLVISLLGIHILPECKLKVREYYEKFLVGKQVLIKIEGTPDDAQTPLPVYLQLTNKLFVNRKMIEMGLAVADKKPHRLREKFQAINVPLKTRM